MKIAVLFITMVWAGACAGRAAAPPAIVVDRSACSRCGMLISEPAYAAAIRLPDGHDQLFDDIGCLVRAAQELRSGNAQYWFHDVKDGAWITGGNPTFVVSPDLRTPMGGGIVAYRDRNAAETAAGSRRARTVTDLPALLALERSSK